LLSVCSLVDDDNLADVPAYSGAGSSASSESLIPNLVFGEISRND
jgi:hypothetical protein